MLTNAMIVDSTITVKPYFEEAAEADDHSAQENKPKVTILAEILAAGYTLGDSIIQKGLEVDTKYGLLDKIQAYVEAAKNQAKTLDEKYHVTAKASEIDNKYHVQDRVNAAVGQGIDYSNQVRKSNTGLCKEGASWCFGDVEDILFCHTLPKPSRAHARDANQCSFNFHLNLK